MPFSILTCCPMLFYQGYETLGFNSKLCLRTLALFSTYFNTGLLAFTSRPIYAVSSSQPVVSKKNKNICVPVASYNEGPVGFDFQLLLSYSRHSETSVAIPYEQIPKS